MAQIHLVNNEELLALLQKVIGNTDIQNQSLQIENALLKKELAFYKAAHPHPCDGPLFNGWSIEDFVSKTVEEHCEQVDAYFDWKHAPEGGKEAALDSWMCECCDEIIAVMSLMEKVGFDAKKRMKYMTDINLRNSIRDGGRRFKG